MFLCPDFQISFEDAPRSANLIFKSVQYVLQHHHMAAASPSTALNSEIVMKTKRMKEGGTILLVSLHYEQQLVMSFSRFDND